MQYIWASQGGRAPQVGRDPPETGQVREFMKKKFVYFGYVITSKGLQPSLKNVEVILVAPKPQDINALQSYIILITSTGNSFPGFDGASPTQLSAESRRTVILDASSRRSILLE